MNSTSIDIPLFQLRLMEEDWLYAIERSLQAIPSESRGRRSMEHVLLAETAKWVELGQEVGYFAKVDSELTSLARFEEEPSVRSFFDFDPTSFSDRGFGAQLANAQIELNRGDRLMFLYVLFFADDDEWLLRLREAESLSVMLEVDPRVAIPTTFVDELSWFLTGPESMDPQAVSPAYWRLAAPVAHIPDPPGVGASARWWEVARLREQVEAQIEIGERLLFLSSESPGSAPPLGSRFMRPVFPNEESQ
jgi:hypothetical protein